MEIIKINDEFIKLDSALKLVNVVASGGEAKMVISEGMVKVNGETENRRGKKLYPGDEVEFNGEIFKIGK